MGVFDLKVALITGSGTGIGRAVALEFAGRGASILVADVNEEEGQHTVELIEKAGSKGLFMKANVASVADCENMVAKAVETFGRLDFACNNAGIGGASAPVADMTPEDWQKVIDINLTGVFFSMKYEIPAMLKVGGGAIVNMASILGQVGFANSAAYVSAKHGVVGLTKTASLEYVTQGIRVNAVCPGFIETPLLANAGITSNQEMRQYIENLHPIGRLGTPEEIAKVVAFLCSSDASFMHGEAVLVDGGYVAR